MTYTLADLDAARTEALDSRARVADARARIAALTRQGRDTTDARVVLGHLVRASRACVERLGVIRHAIGPAAF